MFLPVRISQAGPGAQSCAQALVIQENDLIQENNPAIECESDTILFTFFSLDSQELELYIPMSKQTLNKDGMVTSVEFSLWGWRHLWRLRLLKSPKHRCRLSKIPGNT